MNGNNNTLFDKLTSIYGNAGNSMSERKILEVLSNINKGLTEQGLSLKDIIPEGFRKREGWKKGLAYEIFSEEYYTQFASILTGIRQKLGLERLVVLEVGAGSGIFSKQLIAKVTKDISVIATDIEPDGDNVDKYGYKEAIEQFQPQIIVACWPLIIANTEGESLFIRTLLDSPTVRGCFLIGTPSRCEFDEWWFEEYQEEIGSTFTNIMDIPELSKMQIGMSREEGTMFIKNGVNPLLLGDQGIDDSFTSFLGNTYTTSRTSYISRGNPKW